MERKLLELAQCYYVVMKLEGKATKSLVISIITLAADMIIDFFLIYGIGGAPKLGANGSAYSTVCVELIALTYCIVESYRKDGTHPGYANFKWHSKVILIYCIMCADEIVKLPWLYSRYKKYIWVKNLTRTVEE